MEMYKLFSLLEIVILMEKIIYNEVLSIGKNCFVALGLGKNCSGQVFL